MIIFLYGKDTFRAKRKLKEILEAYQKIYKNLLNFKVLDLKEKNFEDFKTETKTLPFFKEKKLILLKNSGQNQDFQKNFLKEIEKFKGKDIILIFFEEGEIKLNEFFEKLKQNSKSQEFKELDKPQLKFWAKKEFEKMNQKIEERALEILVEIVGPDLWQLDNEIKKLIAFKKGKEILLEDVLSLVSKDREIEIFELINRIFRKEKKESLRLLKEFFEKEKKPLSFFYLFRSQLKKLLILKDLFSRKLSQKEIIEKTKFHPYFIEKGSKILPKFSLSQLKNLYLKTIFLEANLKSSNLPQEIILSLFLFNLIEKFS